jgi:hypothetical protein
MKFKQFIILASLPWLFLLGACEKEYLNPNAATSEDVLRNVDGLLGMVVGLKRTYAYFKSLNQEELRQTEHAQFDQYIKK